MVNKNFLTSIYDDFFGIEKIRKENEKLAEELGLSANFPTIEVKEEKGVNRELLNSETINNIEEQKKKRNEFMLNLFERIEKLYIAEESKNMLKKIIEYMRKYNENIEKDYINFNMCIYSNNKEVTNEIGNIIYVASKSFEYINGADAVQVSFYDVEKAEDVEEAYNTRNAVIIFKDFENFVKKDENLKDKILYKLEENIEKDERKITIFTSSTKELIENALNRNDKLREKVSYFEVNELKPDIQDVYQDIIEKLEANNELEEEFRVKLLDYIAVTYPKYPNSFPEYRDGLIKNILFNKDEKITENSIPKYEKEKTNEEIFAELNELVGLEKVKKSLNDLVNLIELKKKTEGDLKIKDINLHMVFLGNPGTGKTTVARIIAGILYNLKYIKQNKLVEVSSKDLVAEYVGQTAPKTNSVIERAMGGVLFIDEAYSLASGVGQGNSYNEEAVATLIQAMENHRDDLVVIFAGYTKEMQDFLNSNSGIVSRIGYTLEFDDYTENELLQIFNNLVKKSGFKITKDAEDKVLNIIKEYKYSKNFGNARFARSLYEKTVIKHASNTKNMKNKKVLYTIEKEDISTENLLKM
ncbi:MAG: AAA family ATPase [Clostridia bacterium]|nr:AAA family ATPase [Clostridia bacterium]